MRDADLADPEAVTTTGLAVFEATRDGIETLTLHGFVDTVATPAP
jgi:hypothetical protein